MSVTRRSISRIARRYLVDFGSSWILDSDTPLEQVDVDAVIRSRLDEYEERGLGMGRYYNNATPEMKRRLIRDIKKQVMMFRSIRKA